ncbi:MAG: AlkA N-terminal domain-containing protein [Sulfuritalea sp.]|nr:AlkA N-terminal domain-containing protein [Sulfuritalea sp.]
MASSVSCVIALPADFRLAGVLAFHGRDAQGVAEQVDGRALRKGLMWQGQAACLAIRFDAAHAVAELAVDRLKGSATIKAQAVADLVRRMLGLTQPVEAFEATSRRHPQLGPLVARQAGLRVPLAATPFEALTWAITGQQISVAAAIGIRRRLIRLAGSTHSTGLLCHPDAERIARLGESDLRGAGFSQTKARALLDLSREIAAGRLPLEAWTVTLPVEEIRAQLLSLRGVGPWTVNYALLRGFGWLDGSLHGDVAVRRKLQILLRAPEKLGEDFTRRWLADFTPWRALVAAHLWAMPG